MTEVTNTNIPVTNVPNKYFRVLVGISILAYSHEFVQSFLDFWTKLCMIKLEGITLEIAYKFTYRRPVHMAQEELAQFAVDSNCTHLLLMDDDIYDVTPQDLLNLLLADKDVIGGIMFTSKFPYAMCAFRRYNLKTRVAEQPILDGPARLYEIPPEQQVGIQACDLIPFGFTLIKTSVFNEIEKPWFHCDTQAPTDSWFMDSILDAGIKPYAHFDVWLNHNGCTRQTRPFLLQMGMEVNKNKGGVINITQEDMMRHNLIMDMKMKDAEVSRKDKEAGDLNFIGRAPDGNGLMTPQLQEEIK